jgi:hypothetical protein
MKLLFLLLLLPCCVKAQHKVGEINGTFKLTKADVRKAIATDQDALIVLAHRVFMGPKSIVKLVDYWADTLTLAIADTLDHYFPNTYVSCANFTVYPLTPYQYEHYQTLRDLPLSSMHKWSDSDDYTCKYYFKEDVSAYGDKRKDTSVMLYLMFIGRDSRQTVTKMQQHGGVKVNTIIWDTVSPRQMVATSPAGNSLESLDTTHFKVYYTSTDEINFWVVDGVPTNKSPWPLPKNKIFVTQVYMPPADAILYYKDRGRKGAILIKTKPKKP